MGFSSMFAGADEYKNTEHVSNGSNSTTFGLNQGFHLSNVEAKRVGQKELAVINFIFQKGDRYFYMSIFEPNRVWEKGQELQPGTPEYEKARTKAMQMAIATIEHVFEAVNIPATVIRNKAARAKDYMDYITICASLFHEGLSAIDLDVFLEYEPKIRENYKTNFLRVPNSLQAGKFVVPTKVGKVWVAERDNDGLRYKCGEERHPFSRGSFFMTGKCAKRLQVEAPTEFVPDTPVPMQGEVPTFAKEDAVQDDLPF